MRTLQKNSNPRTPGDLTKLSVRAKKDFSNRSKIDSLHEMTQEPILLQILTETRNRVAQGENQTVVFDLDSTLFEVTARNQRILHEFIESEHLSEHGEMRTILKKVQMQLSDHGLESAVRRAGIEFHDDQLKQKLILFWRERFFSDEYLETDQPFAGAPEYVQELYELGAHIYYLTGRDHLRMGVGTPRELLRWKFPLNVVRTKLLMKPQKGLDDSQFKASELEKISSARWFFENEPNIIHFVEAKLPLLNIVYMESSHSGKANPKSDWHKIKSFVR
jgi:hypothetical protein